MIHVSALNAHTVVFSQTVVSAYSAALYQYTFRRVFTGPTVSRVVDCNIIGRLVNNELGRAWKEGRKGVMWQFC
jgi:hypothetical protein